jgi:hypothetical protein
MRLSRRSPHETISETVIAAAVTEARETGRTQIVADTLCTALRLVVTPSANPRWLLFCYNKDGRLEKSSLGRYPKIGVESPLCQTSCRLNRIGNHEGVDIRKWLDTDKHTEIG